ncbi:MAG: serine hydrolase domain-containing protein [Adhaeribacter sp.]
MRCCIMRLWWFIPFFLFALPLAGQSRLHLYDVISRKVQEAYNSRDPRNMYALTAPAYRERMGPASFAEGSKKFYIKAGKWVDHQFREQTDGGVAYTALFERGSQVFFLQLDPQGRILRFNFKPVPAVKSLRQYQVPGNNPMQAAPDSLVDRLVRPYIQQSHTAAICLAIIQKGKVHRYSYGEFRKGSGQLPDPQTTIFEIGSVTKLFTSLLLARAVADKQMRLDDPVNRYLPDSIPELSFGHTALTLQHLSNHTSGLPRLPANIFQANADPSNPYRHYQEDLLYSFLMAYRPSERPGRQFSYSNYGAGLLGCLLARRSNQSFEKLVLEKICHPLKMHHTRIRLRPEDSTFLATGYNEYGAPTALWDLAALEGSGAIRSTLNDMVRFMQAQLGRQPRGGLKKAISLTHQVTFTNQDTAMGLGWRITRVGNKNTYLHHSGGTGGFRSFVAVNKNRRLGVVILSNTAEEVTAIGQALMEADLFEK